MSFLMKIEIASNDVPMDRGPRRRATFASASRPPGRSQDRFDLAVSARGGALHVRDRCHQLERLSPKCHGVEKAHGADGDVDAGC
jgi:hypothetical protein